MEENREQRTEQPTHYRLEKAREKGQVVKSNELTSALVVIGGLVALRLLYPWFVSVASESAEYYLSTPPIVETIGDTQRLLSGVIVKGFRLLSPYLIAILGVAIISNYIQVGFLFSTEPLALSLEKINPIAGAKRLFSLQSLFKTGINLAKATLVGLVFYKSIKASIPEYMALGDYSIRQTIGFMANEAFSIAMKATLILVVLGFVDYAYQRRKYIKNLMMTKQEVKDEHKELEGSPLIKSRIRSRQIALARQRMMEEVPKADVVVTNPVFIAVALKYNIEKMNAPTVVAKGKRLIAEKIKEIATTHGVPVLENKPLARSLYELVEIGSEIPASLYKAVAEILSYVYKLKGRVPPELTGE
jgi:flagellar biosynthetic protein FlhB